MKSSIAVLLLAAMNANATPYFKLLDPVHPQPVAGALLDPADLGKSEAAVLLPLVTHSTKDGCILPAVVCEDWAPLAVGGSINGGKATLDVASLINVLPWMTAAVLRAAPSDWNLQRLVPPDQSITFSAGPVFQYSQQTDRGSLKVFTGLALKF